jgi:hypothetical protein
MPYGEGYRPKNPYKPGDYLPPISDEDAGPADPPPLRKERRRMSFPICMKPHCNVTLNAGDTLVNYRAPSGDAGLAHENCPGEEDEKAVGVFIFQDMVVKFEVIEGWKTVPDKLMFENKSFECSSITNVEAKLGKLHLHVFVEDY